MRSFFQGKLFKIIVLIFALLLGFIIYAFSQQGSGAVTSQAISFIVSPLQKLSSYLSASAGEFFGKYVNADENYRLIQELREENAELRDELVDYNRIKQENEELRGLAGIKEENPDLQMVAATVVSRDPAESFGGFTIDKGALHGIHYRDTVVTAEGLVGVVTEVGEVYSKVTTVLSPELKIGAIERRTGEIGTVSGTVELSESNKCKLFFLGQNSDIQAGDLIVTSGSGGIYPRSIIIGKAGEVQMEDHGITAFVEVTPVFEIDSVKQVFVVTDFYGKSQDGEDDA